jgi:subtilisin-like proprotein convertase family protein
MNKLLAGGVLSAAVLGAVMPNVGSAQSFPNARTRNFNNLTPITIADSCPEPELEECAGLPDYYFNEGGAPIQPPIVPASVYPSPITVPAAAFVAGAKITDVNVKIKGFSHDVPDDVDIILVGPDGSTFSVLASNVGSGVQGVSGLNWKFDDQAKVPLPNNNRNTGRASANANQSLYQLIYPEWVNVWTSTEERSFKPSDYDTSEDLDTLPGVSAVTNTPQTTIVYPSGPYNTTNPAANPGPTVNGGKPLSAFNGQSPTGVWSLYVVDDWFWYEGSIEGWQLEITAAL